MPEEALDNEGVNALFMLPRAIRSPEVPELEVLDLCPSAGGLESVFNALNRPQFSGAAVKIIEHEFCPVSVFFDELRDQGSCGVGERNDIQLSSFIVLCPNPDNLLREVNIFDLQFEVFSEPHASAATLPHRSRPMFA